MSMHRAPGIIEKVSPPHMDDHGLMTWVYVNIGGEDRGGHQGFGGMVFKDESMAENYVDDLCAAFGVKHMEDLVGKKCYVLYAFAEVDEMITGLEACETGKRFLHRVWYKRLHPEAQSEIEGRRHGLAGHISLLKRRLAETEKELASVEAQYLDWETAP